jgi:hypothetical protein
MFSTGFGNAQATAWPHALSDGNEVKELYSDAQVKDDDLFGIVAVAFDGASPVQV